MINIHSKWNKLFSENLHSLNVSYCTLHPPLGTTSLMLKIKKKIITHWHIYMCVYKIWKQLVPKYSF